MSHRDGPATARAAPESSSTRSDDAFAPQRMWKKLGIVGAVIGSDQERSWGVTNVKRVGVPGGLQLNTRQTTRFVFRWRGTAFKAGLRSWAAVVHIGLFVLLWQLATYVQESIMEPGRLIDVYLIDDQVVSAFSFVLAFVIAQYIDFVVHRYNERLSVCIDTGEAALQVALEASVMLRGNKAAAKQLVRYMQLILHLYYLTIDGPMTEAKWALCDERRLVTRSEKHRLAGAHASVSAEPAIVCRWALDIVHTLFQQGKLSSDHAVRMETEVSSARRLASRQRDLHEMGPPMPFFHLMTIMVHAFLAVMEMNAAIRLTIGIHEGDGVRVGELVGVATLILSLNTLRRVALAMTNPFGDDETDYDLDYDLRKLRREADETIAAMPEDDSATTTATASSAHEPHVGDADAPAKGEAAGGSCTPSTELAAVVQRALHSVSSEDRGVRPGRQVIAAQVAKVKSVQRF